MREANWDRLPTMKEPGVEVHNSGEGQFLADALIEIVGHLLGHFPVHLLLLQEFLQ